MDRRSSLTLLPRPVVLFEGKNNVIQATVDERGQFRVTLTAGIYNMTTRIPGFYPFHRARFKVIGGTTVMINVIPTPRSSMPGTIVSFRESAAKLIPFPKFGQVRVFANQH